MIIFASSSFSIVTFAENADTNKINEISEKVEQLSKENKELRTLLDNINKESISKDDIIKSLEDKEGNLIATADHTINRVNFWIGFLGVFVSVVALIGSVAPYFIQKSRIDKLEKDIDTYKSYTETIRNELNTSKEELSKATKLLGDSKKDLSKSTKLLKYSRGQFEAVKSISKRAEECAATAQENSEKQFIEVDGNYRLIKKEMEEIRDEVKDLAGKAKESEQNAKKSENKAKASEYFNLAYSIKGKYIKDINQRIDLYSKAIDLDSDFGEAYNNRGAMIYNLNKHCNSYYEKIENSKKAIEDYSKAIEINSSKDGDANRRAKYFKNRSLAYSKLGSLIDKKYHAYALEDLDKAKDIEGETAKIYNSISMVYRNLGDYDKALLFVDRSLAIDDSFGFAYSTKAEIFAEQGEDDQFYEYIELALKNGCPVWEFIEQDDVYKKYINEPRFTELIDKYKDKEKS
jgi:tetratricopeptide (TPR) repeat protein